MFIGLIISVVGIILLDKWIVTNIEKSQDKIEKIIYCISLIISNIFLIIYYFDRFNLPTELKMNTNVDTQNWLIIVTSCVSSIISAAIGGLIAFGIARNQIEENNKQNSENNRIQNMPLLKYKITSDGTNRKNDEENLIPTKYSNKQTNIYNLKISVTNMGPNNVRHIVIDLNSEIIGNTYRLLGENTQVPIGINESKKIYKFFQLENQKNYEMELKVYYEDVLQNWYLQIIEIIYCTKNIANGKEALAMIDYKVKEERRIKKEEIKL